MSSRATSRLVRFGLFEVDLENARLARKGVRIRLQDQPFRILSMLLEHSGQVVTREELRQELWPAGTYVDFDGSLRAALKRLRFALDDDADNPRFIETVPKRGYRFIAPVILYENPPLIDSEVTAPQVSAVPIASPMPAGRVPPLHASSRRWVIAFGTAVLIVGVAFYFLRTRRVPPGNSLARSTVDLGSIRRSVAILGFQNASGKPQDAWLSTALSEMLRTELGTGGKLRIVPGENVAQFRIDSPWSETDSLSRQTASRIGDALNSDVLVLGSYAAVGDPQDGSIRVDFRLQDAQTGEFLYEGAESGSEKQFFGLVARIGGALRERLGLPMISESEAASVVSSLPTDPDANRFYSLGLAKLRDADVAAAKDLFLQAEKLAPHFPLVHLMLSRAWGGLGYDQKALDEVKLAYQLSASLPEVDKLQIEAAYFGSIRDHERAISVYRALYTLYPDSVDYGEQLIVALNSAGRREEALGIVKQLRDLPPPVSEDPRIDFWQAQLLRYRGGDPHPFFEKAVAGAASRGERLLYARFRLEQCINLVYGAHPQGATAYCKEAYDIFISAGNTLYAADALRTMGDRRGSEGDLTGARELYQQALAKLSKLGEHEKTGVVLNNMAITYENQGQTDEAEKLFRQAAQTWREGGDSLNEAVALGNIADIFMMRGQLRRAEAHYEDARKRLETSGTGYVAYELYSIASIRLYEGDVAGAKDYAVPALTMAQERHDSADVARASSVIGDILAAQGDLPRAVQNYQKALALWQQLGQKGGVAESQAALAEASIEEGNFAGAEPVLRKALAEFRAEKGFTDEVHAETDLSRALLCEGKLAEASRTISYALALSRASRDPAVKLPVAILDARIEIAERASHQKAQSKPDFSASRSKLVNVRDAAHNMGYYGIECDARLALAELELRENPSAGRAHLAQLSREAHERGMELISRKAAALQRSKARLSNRPGTSAQKSAVERLEEQRSLGAASRYI